MRFLTCLAGIFFTSISIAETIQWQPLAPGLEYTTINYQQPYPTSKLHAFRIDPSRYQLQSITAVTLQRKAAFVATFAQTQQALLAINGGYFDPDYNSLGLRINQGKIFSALKSISWWGIFLIKNQQPAIIGAKEYLPHKDISFAIQAGPRLLIDGKPTKLTSRVDSRSAICVTQANQIIIAVTEHLPLTTINLANILRTSEKNGGLACRDALNLDGGHSSQLYAKINDKVINIPNLSPVADVVIVKPVVKAQL